MGSKQFLILFSFLLSGSFCHNNTLNPASVKGKIVVCKIQEVLENRRDKAATIKDAGGIGMILIDAVGKDVAFQFVIPGTVIDPVAAIELQAYMERTK